MHFSGPLVCARVWTFLEARYHNTLKHYNTATGRADRTADQRKGARATTDHHTGIAVPTQPIATYCNLLQPTPPFSSLPKTYQ